MNQNKQNELVGKPFEELTIDEMEKTQSIGVEINNIISATLVSATASGAISGIVSAAITAGLKCK
ncbi:MAG: hypothetical protein LBT80_05505 [Lactobacillaceae bacterium]|jgi:hypothetical protein|nr:hypothetical protein [Lactobacillaceae bacterium]